MTFRVGMKCVCIADDFAPAPYMPNLPVKGGIYTIRGFRTEAHIEGVGLLFEELINPALRWADGDTAEWAFDPSRFRPLVDTKQEVSFTTGAPIDSERWDNRRPVVEPMPVDGWRVGV